MVILSGSLHQFLETFVEYFNIEAEVIGTPLFFDDKGLCTGKIGKLNHGSEKVKNLKIWLDKKDVKEESIWAYADSESDLPLLEFVDKAIVVNPSEKMKFISQKKGWDII